GATHIDGELGPSVYRRDLLDRDRGPFALSIGAEGLDPPFVDPLDLIKGVLLDPGDRSRPFEVAVGPLPAGDGRRRSLVLRGAPAGGEQERDHKSGKKREAFRHPSDPGRPWPRP